MQKRIAFALTAVAAVLVAILIVWLYWRPLRAEDLLGAYAEHQDVGQLEIVYPQDETLFPPEIVAPTFRWKPGAEGAVVWLIHAEFGDDRAPLNVLSRKPQWTPEPGEWELIKKCSTEQKARVLILGATAGRHPKVVAAGTVTIGTSKDEVGAPLFYREVNLPFVDAVKDPSHIRWRFGAISSSQPPPVVLEDLPVCGNCHSFPRDGRTLAMDVDYANSKGSYVIAAIQPRMTLAASNVITWNDYRKEDGEQTFGLLSQISPDGRYVVSTVKDKSVFVPMPDLAFSQLFFPVKGILCVYDRQTGAFSALPGADDPAYVQSNPSWSPDGKYIVFARSEAYDLAQTQGQGKVLLTRAECKEFVEDGKPFLFDLYRLPFNEGRGGTPEPIRGASHNGMSNYFARYSPDGRWIVFCKARSYMLLQRDSELYIVPAEGGEPRRLRANTGCMNSWHSWSPNGKWLVFSSKAYSDYTQLFLTHIDADGNSSPPVLLSHLTAPDRAANIPEFVDASSDAIVKIQEQFLNDYSFVRAGNEFYRHGDAENAIAEYRNALALNPDNVEAHQRLGFLLYHVQGAADEGMTHLLRANELDPADPRTLHDLGMTFLHQGNVEKAIPYLSEALRRMPNGLDMQYSPERMHFQLGRAFLVSGKSEQAEGHLRHVLKLNPRHAAAHYQLSVALADLSRMDESLRHYSKAIELDPRTDTSPALHHLLATDYLQKRQFREALRHEQRALELAQASGDQAAVTRIQGYVDYCRQLVESASR